MTILWAKQALTSKGWRQGVSLTIGEDGIITELAFDTKPSGKRLDILLPAISNTHSHAFQRAMAGLTESRGPDPKDSFWTWRKLMYRFVDLLTPDDIQAIAAFLYMEMLEAGFSAVAEFHYLHHGIDGQAYDNIAETAHRIAAAAQQSGIGLTLLPVLYTQGGCDGRALVGGQKRFGNTQDGFAALVEASKPAIANLGADSTLGVAAHSLRAITPEELSFACNLAPDKPFHIHIAEQTAEIDAVRTHYGQRPVQWLLGNHKVNKRWCLVHATHMNRAETKALAKSGAVAALCSITESNLGDGIFNARDYLGAGGTFSVGSDSNVRISLAEELRTLEYTQRLKHQERAVLANTEHSNGRVLYHGAGQGGAQACGRDSGEITVGKLADLFALDGNTPDLIGKQGDMMLDSFIFSGGSNMITDVWSAGRHMVRDGAHINREPITKNYEKTILSLQQRL
jgi:formimidoylglutamate deiminase